MTQHERPILFLDIDGVLTPTTGVIPRGYGEVTVGETIVVVHRQHGAWLRELAAEFEVVWATSWEAQANEIYCPALDFGTRQYVEFPRPHGGVGWKLPRIQEVARDRAIAWIDDEITTDEWQWAYGRSAPTRLVATKSSIGMTREHVDDLLDWARTLHDQQPMTTLERVLAAFYAALFASAAWLAVQMWDNDLDRWEQGFPTYPQLGIATCMLAGILIHPRASWEWAVKFAAGFALVPTGLLMLGFLGLCAKYGCDEHAGAVLGLLVILGGAMFGCVLAGKLLLTIGSSTIRSLVERRQLRRSHGPDA